MEVLDTLSGTGVFHFGGNGATVAYTITITRTRGGIVSGHGSLSGRHAVMVRAAEVGHGMLARLNGEKIGLAIMRVADGTAFVRTSGSIPGY